MSRIHLSRAQVTSVEEELVLDALRSGWIAPLGPHVDAFEHEVAERVGVPHALALSSGTAALHLALLHVGARPGTVVLVPTMTFAATANAVAYTGAEVAFVDSRGDDGNVAAHLLLQACDELSAGGRTVAAAIPVDLFGRCADYDVLVPGLAERGIPLVEDAAEALGASLGTAAAGSFGLAAALSFNGNKIMTTSGGGMLLSHDESVVERARHLATQARQPVPWYEHEDIGFNYRLSNVLAALGRGQLRRLDTLIERRREIRQRYAELLGGLAGIRLLGRGSDRDDAQDNCWLTSIVLDPDVWSTTADDVVAALSQQEIEARHLWKPMHLQPVFAGRRAFLDGTSEALFAQGVNLPSGADLTDDDVDRVVTALHATLREAA
ncbi:DegT/DnrJ/EryC1/StrS family aminotransferase [Arsenicicoccus dermatophilus]|uniref:DegT/DnrJ/EryC1/StrS family aminotransferase n=1 Tax=Arsenicicoccus dermatophilus TaxID=1076331 RepID=UPI0039172BA3